MKSHKEYIEETTRESTMKKLIKDAFGRVQDKE